MRFLALLLLLGAPAQAAVSLRWAPALGQALPLSSGASGFDGPALAGLQVRLNEIDALAVAGAADLEGLRRLRRRRGASDLPDSRLDALEHSLTVLSPVIKRLESRGVRIDDRGNPSAPLGPALARALADESREDDRLALELASRYGDERALDQAIADSESADALLRDRYPYLSAQALDGLARVYDSGRTQDLVARRDAQAGLVAMVSNEDRTTMRDAVAASSPSFIQRIVARIRALAARLAD